MKICKSLYYPGWPLLAIFWTIGFGCLLGGWLPLHLRGKRIEENGVKNCTLIKSYCENRIYFKCDWKDGCEAY